MPLFEFTCRVCGKQFETLVTASRRAECPVCQSTELDKHVSSCATHLGSGSRAASTSPFT